MDYEAIIKEKDAIKREWLHQQKTIHTMCDIGAIKLTINGADVFIPVGGDGGAKVYMVEDAYYEIPSYYNELFFLMDTRGITIHVHRYDCSNAICEEIHTTYATIHKSGRSVIINYK